MNKNQPLTVGVLKQVLSKELFKHGELINQELRKEIKDNGENIKKELKYEFKKDLGEQEEKIGRHLDTVYGDFENKQAFMAENIVSLNDKVSYIQISIMSIEGKVDSLSGRVFFLEQKFKPAR